MPVTLRTNSGPGPCRRKCVGVDAVFPRRVVEYLRLANHDVAWAGNDFPSSSDKDVLERAETDGRILFTLDRDFWQIAIQRRERMKTCYAVGYRHSSGGTGQSRGHERIDPTHLQPPHTTRPRLNSGFRQGFSISEVPRQARASQIRVGVGRGIHSTSPNAVCGPAVRPTSDLRLPAQYG
jgi:hypothetical protein